MLFVKRRKAALRRRMKLIRKGLAAAHPDSAEALTRNFPDEIWPKIGSVVSGFIPIAGEIDPLNMMAAFACEGAVTALPVVQPGNLLVFRAWKPGDPLHPGPMGLQQPADSAPEVQPDIVLTPLLAFDLKGRRLGWGGGFYDREIEEMRRERSVQIVGIAFDAQKTRRVPVGRWDQPLDWIVTEKTAYRAG